MTISVSCLLVGVNLSIVLDEILFLMISRTPSSTLTDSLFPSMTRFRSQGVKQRRLAGVGVADQRDPRDFAAHPGAAHLVALHLDLVEPLLQLLDALLQQPAVGFQLGFTRAAQADRAAALALDRKSTRLNSSH